MRIVLGLILGIFFISLISASQDIQVWQGSYYNSATNVFNTGTYSFNFTVYDNLTGGNICYTNITNLFANFFGYWKTEQIGVLANCSNQSKDYFLNIKIDGVEQTPRKRLTLIGNYTGYYLENNKINKDGTNSNITSLHFNTSASDNWTVGEIGWDLNENTLSLGMPYGATLQIGKEMYKEVTNLDSVTIYEGQAVSIVGVSGNREAVRLTNSSDTASSTAFIGLATTTMTPNGKGFVTLKGDVHNINTNAWTEGRPLYVNPLQPGNLTQTYPSVPNYPITVGIVTVKNQNVGIISVTPGIALKLTDLADVDGAPLTNSGQVLIWNQTGRYWDPTENIFNYLKNASFNVINFLNGMIVDNLVTGWLRVNGNLNITNILMANYTESKTASFGNGVGNLTINEHGDIMLYGNATQWDDMTVPITATAPGTNAPSLTQFKNNTWVYAYADAVLVSQDSVYATIQMSHSYKLGTEVDCHIHWSCPTTSSDNVTWQLDYTKADIGNVFPDASTILVNATCGTAHTHNLADFHSIGNFSGISGIANFRLMRASASSGDTYTGVAFVHAMDCHYSRDSIGSREEYVK